MLSAYIIVWGYVQFEMTIDSTRGTELGCGIKGYIYCEGYEH